MATLVFVASLLVLLVPYEVLVRRSEAVFGTSRAFVSASLSPMPKIDWMQIRARQSNDLDVLVVGTSVAEYGIDPRLLQQALEPRSAQSVFNASIGGVSSNIGLELAEHFGFRPRWVVVSVTPMDFTDNAQSRGDRFKRHAAQLNYGGDQRETDFRSTIDAKVGSIVRSVLHSSSPLRRRSLPEWLDFLRRGSDVSLLAFLNSPAVVADPCPTCWDGYVGSTQINEADPRYFRSEGFTEAATPEAAAFRAEHRPHIAALERHIGRLQRSGSTVVLVRVPTSAGFRRAEDQTAPDFTTAMRSLSSRTGVPYLDVPVAKDFTIDRNNFVDTHHLSYQGSRLFTTTLGSQLRELKIRRAQL